MRKEVVKMMRLKQMRMLMMNHRTGRRVRQTPVDRRLARRGRKEEEFQAC